MISPDSLCTGIDNPKAIIPLYIEALNTNDLRNAFFLNNLYQIRVEQDTACCYDKSVRGPALALWAYTEMQNPKSREIHKGWSRKEAIEMFNNDLMFVEEKTTNDQLPSPAWIIQYTSSEKCALCIDEKYWKETRIHIIEYYKQHLKNL
jgi:hypothetical protein